MADKKKAMNEEFGKIIFELDSWNQTKCNKNFAIVVTGTDDDAGLNIYPTKHSFLMPHDLWAIENMLESHYPLVMFNDSIQTIAYQAYPAEKQDLICVAPCIKVSLWINSTYWAEHYGETE